VTKWAAEWETPPLIILNFISGPEVRRLSIEYDFDIESAPPIVVAFD